MIKRDVLKLRQRILQLTEGSKNFLYEEYKNETKTLAGLLQTFVHLEFSEEEAIEHWIKILEGMDSLTKKIGREASVYLSLVDYFTNDNHVFKSPMLVEVHVFRQAERLAMVDALTGAFNRRYMDLILRKEYNRCGRYGKNLSVCIIDIDDFKSINDTHGHLFGDEVLMKITNLIKETLREEDVVCRYGGEEFLLVLPETDAHGAFLLAERIRLAVKAEPYFRDKGITFSGGTASCPGSAFDISSLIDSADRALYQAKYDGKDCIVEATTERRKFGRYPHTWDIAVYYGNEKKSITGLQTHNVSLGGLQFECQLNFGVDSALRFEFNSLEENDRTVDVPGKLIWVKKNNRSYLYGVTFLETPQEIEAKLRPVEHALPAMGE